MIVKRIDHIFCALKQPGDVDRIMALFCDDFGLPAAWPAHHFHGLWRFYSGGIFLGNVIFEPVFFESATRVRPCGISLEPCNLNRVLQELENRGIAYQGPMPYLVENPEGQIELYWINIILDKQPIANLSVFLCEFKPNPVFPLTSIAETRSRLQHELQDRGGGSLGVQHVGEIKLGAADLESSGTAWQDLLDPLKPAGKYHWKPGDGPGIRLIDAPREGMLSFEIKVGSLDTVRRFLAKLDVRHNNSENGAGFEIEGIETLLITFKE